MCSYWKIGLFGGTRPESTCCVLLKVLATFSHTVASTRVRYSVTVDLRTSSAESVRGVPKSRSGTLERVKDTLEAAVISFLGDSLASPGAPATAPQASGASWTSHGRLERALEQISSICGRIVSRRLTLYR